jgi:hypothetical protein
MTLIPQSPRLTPLSGSTMVTITIAYLPPTLDAWSSLQYPCSHDAYQPTWLPLSLAPA